VCSTPYILNNGECCLDENSNGVCDTEEVVEGGQVNLLVESWVDGSTYGDEYFEQVGVYVGDDGVKEEIPDIPEDKLSGGEVYFLGSGDPDGLFLIYGDYFDSFSKKFNEEILPLLVEEYKDVVRFEYKDLPKEHHKYGKKAGEAANCAGEQGRFWDYHNKLFSEMFFTESNFRIYAAEIGLDVTQFDVCLSSGKYLDEVLEDIDEAKENSVSSVPSFLVNDKRVSGLRTFDYFKKILDEDLKFFITQEYVKKLTASVQGDGNFILPGAATLDTSVSDSFYTEKLLPLTGKVHFSGEDKTIKDSIFSEDSAELSVQFSKKSSAIEEVYTLKIANLLSLADSGVNHHGGVATDLLFFGGTGRITNLLPETYANIYVWAEGELYGDDGMIYDDLLIDFYVVSGIRDNGNIVDMQEGDMELYVYARRNGNGKMLEFNGDGVYLYWEEGINLKSV
tara:strand:- start:2608 stop:3960 length:1353 start_codon:yes stop_codon:yes gene_type:complete